MRALLVLGLLGVATAAQADDSITYKGMPLGSPMEEFRAKFPAFECSGARCIYTRMSCIGYSTPPGGKPAAERAKDCDEQHSFGGSPIEYGAAEFMDGRLGRLYFTMPTRLVSGLVLAATERYGKPDNVDEEPFRTQGGGVFPNTRASWRRGTANLHITANSGKLGQGSAMVQSDEAARASIERQKSSAKKGANDF